jgi:hypothetical protein
MTSAMVLLQQQRKWLLAVRARGSVKFSRGGGTKREMDTTALDRQISHLSRSIQRRRWQR